MNLRNLLYSLFFSLTLSVSVLYFLLQNMRVCVCVVACVFLFQVVAVNAAHSFTRCLEAEIRFDTVASVGRTVADSRLTHPGMDQPQQYSFTSC